MKFLFDQEKHVYTLDGLVLPGVTTVEKDLYDFTGIKPEVLKMKAEWGTKVHTAVTLYLEDNLDESSLSDPQANVLNQFKLFMGNEGAQFKDHWKTAVCELPMFHKKLKYAGKQDIVLDPAIIDLKSRPYNHLTDDVQLEAYDHLCRSYLGSEPKKHFVLSLFEDHYTFTPCRDYKQAWSKFRLMLDHYWAKQEYNNKIKIWKGAK